MGHKEGHWAVHEEYIVHTAVWQKAQATSNSEKLKPVALAIIELRLSEGNSQSITQSFSH